MAFHEWQWFKAFFLQKDKKTVYTFVVYSVNPKVCIIFDKYTQTT